MDIASWLQKLGLERYEQAFRDNEIDAEILPKLTADDLSDIGITAVGHRRKLLEAIAALDQKASAPQTKGSTHEVETPGADQAQAERRQLTIMFVDMVGSTELSARLDPEDMSTIIRAYQNVVAGEITRFEGHIAKYMGDGVLAYFGWPQAHEDEAERAVRAGLSIMRIMGDLTTPAGEPLAARAGIATGLVVVGDLIGEGAAQEEVVVGDTPNLAARLQGLAEPGAVVIAPGTRRLVGGLFELTDLGEHGLKGFGAQVPAYAVKGERTTSSRFEARSGPVLPPMVGRDQELALLLERWALAKAGEGQGVLLVGEAGIGKSRINHALLDALTEEPHTRIRYQCSPYHTDSSLWPVIQQLSHAAGLTTNDTIDTRLDKVEALLDRADGRDAAPLIADLIGIDGAARYGPLDLTPQAQRAQTLAALVEQLLGLAAAQPVLLVLEDAHWIDPTTLELISQALDRLASVPVLVMLTSRPDRQPELAGHPHVTRLTLNRLGRAGVEAIVARLGGDEMLAADVIDTIISRADGMPLFVEELTKAILETGETTIPASLHDSLMARLDRIPNVKEIAQLAACIGREFTYTLLEAVGGKADTELRAGLDKLAATEIVFCRGTPPEARYTFKHALVQDAAYQSILKSKRQQIHGCIAEMLEERFPETVAAEPELLAHHYTGARQVEPAVGYWQKAGEQAIRRSANVEAINHLERGLSVLAGLSDKAEHDRRELALQLDLGQASMAVKGQASTEVHEAYARARQLGPIVGDAQQHFRALWGVWRSHIMRSQCSKAHEVGLECLKVAERSGNGALLLAGRFATGGSLCFMGEFRAARKQLEQAIALYDFDQHSGLCYRYGQDPGASSMSYLGWVLWFLGLPEQAISVGREAITLAEKLAHPFTLAQINMYHAMILAFARKWDEARAITEPTIALSRDQGFPQVLWLCSSIHGRTMVETGEPTLAAERVQEAVTARKEIPHPAGRLFELGMLAEAYAAANRNEKALEVVAEGLLFSEQTEERMSLPEIQRLKGELLQRSSPSDSESAEVFLRRALKTACKQETKSLELRSAVSLARLLAERGRRQEAIDLLHPVYAWFTEGFDTPDLIDARVLLGQLA